MLLNIALADTRQMSNALEKTVKLLLVAEHASARFGGEALIPYQYFKHLRQLGVDIHLLVHERTRHELCEAFPNDVDRLHFVTDSRINVYCYKLGKWLPERLAVFTLGALSHFDTQIRQRRVAKSLVAIHGFDVLHEPIPVSPKLPSMMFGLGAPVIIGPMNGGMDYPPNYDLVGRMERLIISVLRGTSSICNAIVPGKRQAAVILVANSRTADALPANIKHPRILQFAENGVDLERFRVGRTGARDDGMRIIFLGRLVDCKRVDLLLSACDELVGRLNFRLHIVGDGPLRSSLEAQARETSLAQYTVFHGFLPQAEAAELLRNCDVMVLPSMRECGGAVVLEAMAAGLPVIATKWGGPTDYVTQDTGILIPPEEPEKFIGLLADALLWMAKNPTPREGMGRAGRQRVERLYDWRLKAEKLLGIYQDVAGQQALT